jgi:outer membrane protein insertion porin family
VVASDSYFSTRGPIVAKVLDPSDATKLIDAPTGTVAANVLRQFSFQAPEGDCAGLNGPDTGKGCNTVKSGTFFTPVGADTQLIWNIEYRVPIISILSLAAFADVGTAFNSRKYEDQITSSNFVNGNVTPSGVLLNPAGRVATDEEVVNAPKNPDGTPAGFRTVLLQGDSQRFDILRTSQGSVKFLNDLRSSLGMEVRVQMPVINVPFRLIFAYNPQARTDLTDPTVLFIERKTVVRFSVGRTF